ncbi:hypothetical protein B0T22DRAFT_300091 [Podospora appendiculata]|uniref:Oxidase ustYa n=1 Tax=Podospora appendiculata TaxID=314037 RepID=A0AAE0WZR2_9PEZI|nr:hypothetical protein B0T22DRAFT_300091 [Podospora appendiculata]
MSTIRSIIASVQAQRYGPVHSDEEEEVLDNPSPARTTTGASDRYARILLVVVTLLSLGWATTLVCWYKATSPQDNGPLHVYHNTPIPREVFVPVKKVFEPDERYVGGGPEVEKHWDQLVAGHDAVWIENPSQWGLPQGILAPFDHPNTPDPKPQDFYVISILHQLHCLNMIRFQYYQEKNRADMSASPDAFKWKVHVEHCFEYLRVGISCGGDLIIEGNSPIKVGEGHATSVTGWGVEHDCINFERLREFQIEQEAKYNATWQNPR